MRSLKNVLFILLAFLTIACQTQGNSAAQSSDDQKESNDIGPSFGADFDPATVLAFNDLTAKVSEGDSVQVTVQGTVDEVCQSKGCWMTIQGGENDGMMVRFKDYGFFMPKDISGREVIMNGKAFYRITPVDELRHYAEDAGKSEEEIQAITEPKRELSFLADGVILVNE